MMTEHVVWYRRHADNRRGKRPRCASRLTRILCGTLLCVATPALAQVPILDRPWPPDPALYEASGTEVAAGLKIGDVLGRTNAAHATDLLPPEILRHYKTGGYANPLVSWPPGLINYERSFEQASRDNQGKYEIALDTGTIIERATGTRPEDVYGIPFPEISEDDPLAGIKALWNQFYVYWHQGSAHIETLLVWANPQGIDRQSTQDFYFQYYENQLPRDRVPNPQSLTWQFVGITKSPADLQGTVTLSYRYRDPKRRDSVWTYLPALRRVRPVSPANRSDGFLGSDLSEDDAQFFDGKPEDFVWKTVGLHDGLRFVDPESIAGKAPPARWVKPSGWHNDWSPSVPPAGYMKPGWKGLAWAPVSAGLARRKFWVVEGVPRDHHYLYGSIELWIDAEAWVGAFNRKFSWNGELLNSYAVSAYLSYPAVRQGASEVEWIWGSRHAWQCAENVKMHRATLAGIRSRWDGPADRRVRHDIQQLFNLQSLSRLGK